MKYFISILRQFAFWMLYFALLRIIFILVHIKVPFKDGAGIVDLFAVFWHAIRLDMATASYLLVVPFFFLLLHSILKANWLHISNYIYTGIVVTIYSFISAAETGVYDEWKTKLPAKSLNYLQNPGEIYNSAPTWMFIVLILVFLFQSAGGMFLYVRYFYKTNIEIKRNWTVSLLFIVLLPPLIILGIRGGIQEIPVNQSQSYFSTVQFLNIASTNTGYNFFRSVIENKRNMKVNPFKSYEPLLAKKTVSDLYAVQPDTTVSFLTGSENPNLVIIILEGWSADVIESLGGIAGVSPEFKKLQDEGILFTRCYSSGSRSEQGMAAIFSAFPAHPVSSITLQPDKFSKLPSMIHGLVNKGYSSSFYFGGQLIYGNMKGYIYYNRFKRVTEIYDFPAGVPKGKLGVHDPYVYKRMFKDLHNEKQPFVSAIFTSSSHSPFDMPTRVKTFLKDDKSQNMYLNGVFYADSSLGDFISRSRAENWYKNTLFVVVSDHSHDTYKNHPYHSPGYHHIPMLIFGDLVKREFRGSKYENICSQLDIVATVLAQFEMEYKTFHWSKNLFNPYIEHFAGIAFDDGIGWVRPWGYFFYENRLDRFHCLELPDSIKEKTIREGKSFLQVVFQEYMDY